MNLRNCLCSYWPPRSHDWDLWRPYQHVDYYNGVLEEEARQRRRCKTCGWNQDRPIGDYSVFASYSIDSDGDKFIETQNPEEFILNNASKIGVRP